MEQENSSELVPKQETGVKIDVEERVELGHPDEAEAFFRSVSARLLDVNNWKSYAGKISADFQLIDINGHKAERPVKEGDYIQIDIPGPGPQSGDGFDWVKVEKIAEETKNNVHTLSMRVRPTPSPLNDETSVAHFYSRQSTSTFSVSQNDNKITVGIFDRNTEPNKNGGSAAERIRDKAVGLTAITAFSRIQWTLLAKGLLSRN